jgi:hypothetical protein
MRSKLCESWHDTMSFSMPIFWSDALWCSRHLPSHTTVFPLGIATKGGFFLTL